MITKTERCGRTMVMCKGGKNKSPVLRCTRKYCNSVRSIRAENSFFVCNESKRRKFQVRLSARTRIDIVFKWLYSNDSVRQFSILLRISVPTLFECYYSCRARVTPLLGFTCTARNGALWVWWKPSLMLSILFTRYELKACSIKIAVLGDLNSLHGMHITRMQIEICKYADYFAGRILT